MAIAKNGKAMAHGIGVTISKKEDMTVFWLLHNSVVHIDDCYT